MFTADEFLQLALSLVLDAYHSEKIVLFLFSGLFLDLPGAKEVSQKISTLLLAVKEVTGTHVPMRNRQLLK